MKIACIGTHGAGKSTLCYQLADYFKRNKSNVYVVHERVRHSPFPLNSDSNYKTTIWACTNQITKEIEAQQRGYDTIICDRCVYDCIIYAKYFGFKEKIIKNFEKLAIEWLETYDFIFLCRPDMEILEDSRRDTDEKFMLGIDSMFEKFFWDTFDVFKSSEILTSNIISSEVDFDLFFKLGYYNNSVVRSVS